MLETRKLRNSPGWLVLAPAVVERVQPQQEPTGGADSPRLQRETDVHELSGQPRMTGY